MSFCRNCGKQMDENANVCPSCGTKVNDEPVKVDAEIVDRPPANVNSYGGNSNMNGGNFNNGYNNGYNNNVVDNGGIGWGLLGCCIPIVGLILFLVWKDTKPNTAKAAGIGALVSVGLGVLYYIFVIGLGIGLGI